MAPVALGMSDRDPRETPGPRAVQAIVDVVALPRCRRGDAVRVGRVLGRVYRLLVFGC
jgi:hypothetical protein